MFGSLLGGLFGAAGQGANAAFQIKMLEKQQDFAERMSNTRFQRARKDLDAAGYHPLLALGHSASMPGAASAASLQAMNPNFITAASQEAKNRADADKSKEETKTEPKKREKIDKDVELLSQQVKNLIKTIDLLDTEMNRNQAAERELDSRTALQRTTEKLRSEELDALSIPGGAEIKTYWPNARDLVGAMGTLAAFFIFKRSLPGMKVPPAVRSRMTTAINKMLSKETAKRSASEVRAAERAANEYLRKRFGGDFGRKK